MDQVSNPTVSLYEGIALFNSPRKTRVAIGDNEVELLVQEAAALQVSKESFPGSLIFLIRELKGEDLFMPLLFF